MPTTPDHEMLLEQQTTDIERLQRRVTELEQAVELHVEQWTWLGAELGVEGQEAPPDLIRRVQRLVGQHTLQETMEGPGGSFMGDTVDGDLVVFVTKGQDALQDEVNAAVGELFDMQRCRKCGCTNAHGCPEGCGWVDADLCSACCDEIEPFNPDIDQACDRCDATLSGDQKPDGWEWEDVSGDLLCPRCAVGSTLGEPPVSPATEG